jgi:hypothetical protein
MLRRYVCWRMVQALALCLFFFGWLRRQVSCGAVCATFALCSILGSTKAVPTQFWDRMQIFPIAGCIYMCILQRNWHMPHPWPPEAKSRVCGMQLEAHWTCVCGWVVVARAGQQAALVAQRRPAVSVGAAGCCEPVHPWTPHATCHSAFFGHKPCPISFLAVHCGTLRAVYCASLQALGFSWAASTVCLA